MSQSRKCPICGKISPSTEDSRSEFFPFCSDRCKRVDFFRWTDGRYAIVESLTQEQLAVRMIEDSEVAEGEGREIESADE